MDVSKQVDSIVDDLVKGIESRLENRVSQAVTRYLDAQLADFDYESKLNWLASVKLDHMISELEINKGTIENRLNRVADIVIQDVTQNCQRLAQEHVRGRLNDIDVMHTVRTIVTDETVRRMDTQQFPQHSIPSDALNTRGLLLSGDNVRGGVIAEFNSTGIQDLSTGVQMTLLDTAVVVENNMITLGLEVRGTTVLDGDLVINGQVPPESKFYTSIISSAVAGVKNSMDSAFFGDYSTVIFDKIREEGLDLNRITLNGTEVIVNNQLNYGIVDTNIQRVGRIKDLQTQGDTYLSDTLYIGQDKVGVNTIDPGHSLSIWDQEVELGFGKRMKDTAWMGTPRNQNLIISANGADNLTLMADGSVRVQQLQIGKVHVISSTGAPKSNHPRGTVAFNETPGTGQPVGWVCLGNDSWSPFGMIG